MRRPRRARPVNAAAEAPGARGLWPVLGRSGLLLAGLLAAGLALRGISPGNLAGVSAYGAPAFVLLGAAACAIGTPRQMVAFAAGYGFGAAAGTGLALLAAMGGCLADFVWARAIGRDWVRSLFGRRAQRLDAALCAQPFTATLTLRLLPVGNNLLLNLAAGLSGIAAGPFLAASLLGYVPQTVIFALLGGGVQVARWAQIGLGVGLFAASALAGLVLLRRSRRATEAGGTPPAPAIRKG